MLETPRAFIEPVKAGASAAYPEITRCIFVYAVNVRAFTEPLLVARVGNIMGDFSRFSVQSIETARKQAYPQNTIGILINRLDPAGGETIGVCGAMPIRVELLLPKIEHVESRILSSYPQHAASIPIDRENGVVVEAIRVAFVVLKPVRETFCPPVVVVETQAGWHP
jgi:hypothetical protein